MGITIKDVAAAAGTSVSTVSKVINGHYSISEETAARVRRVMQELNYYPNASAQSFARGTTKTIAVLANLAPNTAFQNPHMFEIIAGLEESLSARGYRLQLRGVDPATAYEVAKEVIYRQSADALAIHVSGIPVKEDKPLRRFRSTHCCCQSNTPGFQNSARPTRCEESAIL